MTYSSSILPSYLILPHLWSRLKTIWVKNEVIRDLNLHFNINLWLILHQYCLHMWYCLICGHGKDNFSEEWSHQRPKFTIITSTYDLFFINIAFICDTVSSVIMIKTISVKKEVIRDLNLHFNSNLWLILHQYCLHMWYWSHLKNDHDLNLHFNIKTISW